MFPSSIPQMTYQHRNLLKVCSTNLEPQNTFIATAGDYNPEVHEKYYKYLNKQKQQQQQPFCQHFVANHSFECQNDCRMP